MIFNPRKCHFIPLSKGAKVYGPLHETDLGLKLLRWPKSLKLDKGNEPEGQLNTTALLKEWE